VTSPSSKTIPATSASTPVHATTPTRTKTPRFLPTREALWIADPTYLLISVLAAATLAYARFLRPTRYFLLAPDAFGLAAFTFIGRERPTRPVSPPR